MVACLWFIGSVAKGKSTASHTGSVAKGKSTASHTGSVAKEKSTASHTGSVAKGKSTASHTGSVAKEKSSSTSDNVTISSSTLKVSFCLVVYLCYYNYHFPFYIWNKPPSHLPY